MSKYYFISKRLFDLFFSLVFISVLSPFLILIIIALALSGSDIFYSQNRIGYKGKPFKVFKFSTMLRDSLNLPGGAITVRNDPRITKLGFWLRITKLNELPQLFNVLLGSMSFVGPRPYMMDGFSKFTSQAQEKMQKMTPGITGISSVVFRDEEYYVTNCNMDPLLFYNNVIFPYKSELEIWYYHHRSFLVDIIILALTALKILFPKSKVEYKVFSDLPANAYFMNFN